MRVSARTARTQTDSAVAVRCAATVRALVQALFLIALAGGVSACSGSPVREVPMHLERSASVFVDRRVVARGGDRVAKIPVPRDGTERLEIEAPGKAPVGARLRVVVDPAPEDEDRLLARAAVNTVVYYTASRSGGVFGAAFESAYILPEPLALLRGRGGAWSLPKTGSGIVLVGQPPGTRVQVDGRVFIMEPLGDGRGSALPLVIELEPGAHEVRVERPGRQPWRERVPVHAGRYALLSIHLAPRPAEEP